MVVVLVASGVSEAAGVPARFTGLTGCWNGMLSLSAELDAASASKSIFLAIFSSSANLGSKCLANSGLFHSAAERNWSRISLARNLKPSFDSALVLLGGMIFAW